MSALSADDLAVLEQLARDQPELFQAVLALVRALLTELARA